MKLSALILSACLGLMATAALGQPPPPPGTSSAPTGAKPPHQHYCATHQQECAQAAQKFDQWCGANADKCVGLKAHIEKRREMCEQHKDKCAEMRQQMRQKAQQWCQANPDKPRCKAMQGQQPQADAEDDDDDGGPV
jgi:hypothetical protein